VVDGGQPDRRRLALLAHHLVIDGVSWRVLLDDLRTGFRQAAAGAPVRLPAAGTPVSAWAHALAELARTREITADLPYWLAQTDRATSFAPDVPDAPDTATEADTAEVRVSLDAEQTRLLLREVPRAYRTHIDDVLLTALALAIADETGVPETLLLLEGHGREQHLVRDADLARALGWFTSLAPVRLAVPPGADHGSALKAVKEQLRALPAHGLSYGLLRYLHPDHGPELAARPDPVVSFNYLGQFDTTITAVLGDGDLALRQAPEPAPPAYHPGNRRPHLLDVVAVTTGGRLAITFAYSTRHYTGAIVRRLADRTTTHLDALITHCVRDDAGGYTPSDFPESGLDQEQLDLLLTALAD
jgi:non-ribosomal peptide synthase protein (TIGR01720 family)